MPMSLEIHYCILILEFDSAIMDSMEAVGSTNMLNLGKKYRDSTLQRFILNPNEAAVSGEVKAILEVLNNGRFRGISGAAALSGFWLALVKKYL
jgi:hypothetical protein